MMEDGKSVSSDADQRTTTIGKSTLNHAIDNISAIEREYRKTLGGDICEISYKKA